LSLRSRDRDLLRERERRELREREPRERLRERRPRERLRDRERLLLFLDLLRERDLERDRLLDRLLDLDLDLDLGISALIRRIVFPLNSVLSSSSIVRSIPSADLNSTTPSPFLFRWASQNVTSPTLRQWSLRSCHETVDGMFSTMTRCLVRSGGGRRLRGGEDRRNPGCRSSYLS